MFAILVWGNASLPSEFGEVFAILSLGRCVSLGTRALAILVGGSVLGTFVCHLSLGEGLFASLCGETCLCHMSLEKRLPS